jgi:hypothetical protein
MRCLRSRGHHRWRTRCFTDQLEREPGRASLLRERQEVREEMPVDLEPLFLTEPAVVVSDLAVGQVLGMVDSVELPSACQVLLVEVLAVRPPRAMRKDEQDEDGVGREDPEEIGEEVEVLARSDVVVDIYEVVLAWSRFDLFVGVRDLDVGPRQFRLSAGSHKGLTPHTSRVFTRSW